ncbi:MAG: glutamine amidotransferase, partial [Planctomycetota bacterium]
MQNWTIQPITSLTLLTIAAVGLTFLLFLGPSFSEISKRRRWSLIGIRLGIIGLAFVAMLRPGFVQKVERSHSATMLFLIDLSRSMDLPHRADDSTRFGAMKKMLEANESLFENFLENDISVKFYGFDSQIVQLDYQDGKLSLPDKPIGSETDIGTSVFETALSARKERLIGVFIASDGVTNVLDPKIEISQSADILNDMSVPLYAIPFGLPGNNGQVADVAVMSLPEQHRIAVNNQLNVNATVSARGFANQPVQVQLFVTDEPGDEQLVNSVQFIPENSYVEKKVLLRYQPTVPGQFRMRVVATPNGNELATRNNELPSFLNVYDGGIRVLYLDGNVGWEQKFLRDAISTAAQGVELVRLTIFSNDESRKRWPLGSGLTEWLQDPTVSVIIIGDVDSRALYDANTQTENMDLIVQAVDQGKGLLMLGGPHSFGPGGYHSTPLDDILPIEMNLDERQDFPPAPLRKDLHINEPVKLVPVADHFVTRLGAEANYRAAWESLPPLVGANRFVGVKDNSQILLKSQSGNPILVSGRLGGRVLAFAGDSTWRWVMQDREDEFKQFWRQILLWLASQDGREKNSVWIDL